MAERKLHLNAFLMGVGHHEAAWRHPRTDVSALDSVAHFQNLAKIAERGTFDSVFLADGVQIWGDVRHSIANRFEPVTLLTALAAVTEHIGLIATASTGFSEPYNLARLFASLDHISGGRAGWNIVTTAGDRSAQNFNRDTNFEHARRYERAAEFLEVTTALWDSWEDDALIVDPAAGVYADDTKVHEINHRGEWFCVRGPLNATRSPQGRPLLVQAGSSEDGKAFAARWAEAVFTAQQTFEDATTFYTDLKRLVAKAGRAPEHLKVLPGIVPVLGGTEQEARALAEELDDLIIPTRAVRQLTEMIGIDLTDHPLDEPLPALPPVSHINGAKSRFELVRDLAERERLTLRQLLARLGGGRGHQVVAGTPEQIADHIELWFRNGAADGFNVMAPLLPSGLEDFVETVIPLLRSRGLFRTEYEAKNLRGHYGLPRPESKFAKQPLATVG
ncbi:FMN-dependent oxidoreductase, nitrilotriacetate monooxygenase family [Actinokineospora alba]|uniref:FMN-dependent oxidoreductase, nitrilotriacetate monooxygenase family n=1 Tax=Actinokineospora alba TaxID=504798 RepID=A0A1H0G7M7_9PSEU|nr:LLM class flavin-dependent oxidoreductase [Actinokineospora alba]TDP69796.1 FMN-dependent oxidoreductase (nitrilotriacetate monooxygenase family) [Actinokineospora alba]SDI08515.1 FMN-dependent oxidoreductase, nitrilotriacetate monooxygenase family [Actinokineospora alba]SDO02907.1 FMN-dependent oxidoreductase, nitrilotriacetate monooxygenase family [Actinokineospora alba]